MNIQNISRAEAALLSQFIHGATLTSWGIFRFSDFFDDVEQTCKEFIQAGLLVEPSLDHRIRNDLKIPEIKDLLSRKNVKGKGKKAELINQLVTVYSEQELLNLIPPSVYYYLSSEGQAIVNNYHVSEKGRMEDAISRSLIAIKRGKFNLAARIANDFFADSIPVPGIGITKSTNSTYFLTNVVTLRIIATKTPTGLKSTPESQLKTIRSNASIKYLFSEFEPEPDYNFINSKYNFSDAIKLMINFALNKGEVDTALELSRKHHLFLELSTANDVHVCDHCKEVASHRYAPKNSPEVPLVGCTNEGGCRCQWIISLE